MPDLWSQSLLENGMSVGMVLLCMAAALLFGLGVAALHTVKNTYSKSFIITVALLPAVVQIIVMLVNGNIGAGIAVAGAFSLVRFRSIPGGAREIGSVFLAMALGFVTGMGYPLYGLLFLAVLAAATLVLIKSPLGDGKQAPRVLKIVIPEHLDYDGLFDDLFAQYAPGAQLERVKTTNMGSLFELTYRLECPGDAVPKAFVDALRQRNGNLAVNISREVSQSEGL
ncbi:MAG: DUF4956 domain-containing protein [Oscillospiraceae bacterium]|jgi:hypothetical protein|nr:DUF4956 domain-containing protein [Oscillospiraceae bacterium]